MTNHSIQGRSVHSDGFAVLVVLWHCPLPPKNPNDQDGNEYEEQFCDLRQKFSRHSTEQRCGSRKQADCNSRSRVPVSERSLQAWRRLWCMPVEYPHDDDRQEKQRQQRGESHRKRLCICQRIEQTRLTVFQEEHRKERGQNDEKGEHQRSRDC